jgi:2-polyprenyl-3-methyl-5-hydroxy-6-metoxy-1,4-benzoquinol methylase
MNPGQPTHDAVRAIWDANAEFWNEKMAEGNLFHLTMIGPTAEKILAIEPGMRVAEFACGNGQFSRRMAELGAEVEASDISPKLIELAIERTNQRPEIADRIRYSVIDAAKEDDLAALGKHQFDAAVCNMAIMDMIEVEPLYRAAASVLKPGGRFVFTIMHPCFNNPGGNSLTGEVEDIDGEMTVTYAVRVKRYRSTGAYRGLAIVGQPEKQWYFHRTLAELLSPALAAGLVIDGLEEAYLPANTEPGIGVSWRNFSDIPPVLGVRLRKLG